MDAATRAKEIQLIRRRVRAQIEKKVGYDQQQANKHKKQALFEVGESSSVTLAKGKISFQKEV